MAAEIRRVAEVVLDYFNELSNGSPAWKETVFSDFPDDVVVTVRYQMFCICVTASSRTQGRFQINIFPSDPDRDRIQHRRTWNQAARQSERYHQDGPIYDGAGADEFCWELHCSESIVLGGMAAAPELTLFLVLCFLRWKLCPSLHEGFVRLVAAYVTKFHVPYREHVIQAYGSIQAFRVCICAELVSQLRSPEHHYEINRYIKRTIWRLAFTAKAESTQEQLARWTETAEGRALYVEDAATLLGVTKQTLYEQIRNGRVRVVESVDRRRVVPESEFMRLKTKKDDRKKKRMAVSLLQEKCDLKPEAARKAVQRMGRDVERGLKRVCNAHKVNLAIQRCE